MNKFRVETIAGRGKALIANTLIKSGDVVLTEKPILQYAMQKFAQNTCSNCLKWIQDESDGVICGDCRNAIFCSTKCQLNASKADGPHSPLICSALKSPLISQVSEEVQNGIKSLLPYLNLKNQNNLKALEAVEQLSQSAPLEEDFVQEVNQALQQIGFNTVSAEKTRMWMQIEQTNAIGISLPWTVIQTNEEELRCEAMGSALYYYGSFVNHDCLPNMARTDFIRDEGGEQTTVMQLTALHDIPAGEELTISYFPLDWDYEERQERCNEVYGFNCQCQRCLVESGVQEEQADGMNFGYINVFLLKYVCGECGATYVPQKDQDYHKCSLCGHVRTDKEFEELFG
eukprot:TRINITY_DN4257_c0_g1_i3.p1 TRINITY_DN4257_c0_g1~~TRINITY_DN4257_c0_g1_i3.p1  ORF type:complete len:344 (+),score=37.23 TRINITY_DN4257_c0_g1_i3:162-1193(+)